MQMKKYYVLLNQNVFHPGDIVENCTVGSFFRELAQTQHGKPLLLYNTASSKYF
jgi:hypothetical protein